MRGVKPLSFTASSRHELLLRFHSQRQWRALSLLWPFCCGAWDTHYWTWGAHSQGHHTIDPAWRRQRERRRKRKRSTTSLEVEEDEKGPSTVNQTKHWNCFKGNIWGNSWLGGTHYGPSRPSVCIPSWTELNWTELWCGILGLSSETARQWATAATYSAVVWPFALPWGNPQYEFSVLCWLGQESYLI